MFGEVLFFTWTVNQQIQNQVMIICIFVTKTAKLCV